MLFALVQLDVGIMAVVQLVLWRRWQLHFGFRHVDRGVDSPESSSKGGPSTTEQYYNR